MKAWIFSLIIAIALAGCAGRASNYPLLAENGVSNVQSDRRILVTFVDRSINRYLPANPSDPYQPRGQYANSSWSERVATNLADRHGIRLLAQWPVTVLGVACVVYEVPADRPLEQTLQSIAEDKQVGSVQTMREYRVLRSTAAAAINYNDPYLAMQKSLAPATIAAAHQRATGKGVRIAVIDTGVDVAHPDLTGKIASYKNMAPLAPGADTADVHGTAVAGVLAAQPNNGIGIVGIAPGAEIVSLRACWPEATGSAAARCNSYSLALALNEAIRIRADIINLSLTGPDDPLIKLLVDAAVNEGIIVVAAVPDGGSGGFPANQPGVFAVSDSSTGNGPGTNQLAAPGRDVLTTVPHGAYNFMTGSSFAAPQIAGVIALLRQLKPKLSAPEIHALLTKKDLTSPLEAIYAVVN
jgi:subtilisin family serine protease